MYLTIEDYANRGKEQEIFEANKDKSWFVYKPKLYSISEDSIVDESRRYKYEDSDLKYIPDACSAKLCLILKADNGSDYQLSAFWLGYFEKLYSAEIVIEGKDFKIEF